MDQDTHETKNVDPNTQKLLPQPAGGTKLDVGGEPVKLDSIGPMVINTNGTISRIANWETMTDDERARTLRVLGKRNQIRYANAAANAAGDHEQNLKPSDGP